MSISVDELRALAARARTEAEAAGELAKPGSPGWDVPRDIREALLEDLHSGVYDERLRTLIVDEPED